MIYQADGEQKRRISLVAFHTFFIFFSLTPRYVFAMVNARGKEQAVAT
jgi:hypothetical protein